MNVIISSIAKSTCILLLANSAIASDIFIAKASWRLFDGNVLPFTGTGESEGAALEDARSMCVARQTTFEWKAYCFQAPVSVTFQKAQSCEPRWSSCIGWGQGVGNPCDEGCYRGNQIEENIKLGCTEHRFQCLRDVGQPSILKGTQKTN